MTAYNFQQLIDFTRTSSATFVGSNGLIQNTPASVNLLTWTQEFDNAVWTKTDTTVTVNSLTAPDGTGTGDTLTEGSAGSAQVGATGIVPTAGATAPYSIYLKRGNTDWVRIQILNGANGFRAWFNLNTGAVGTSGALGTGTLTEASIVNAGDGWYRCILVGAIPSTTTYSVFTNTASANNSGTRVSGGTYAAWGAQLEIGSTATTYTRNVGGLFPARFDYDPVTLAPRGILIEEQRTNLATYSEQFDNASWAKNGTTVTANATASPDGTTDAEAVIETTASSVHEVNRSVTLTATAHTYSAFVKANGRSWVRLFAFQSGLSGASVWFNVSTGVVGTVGAGATNATITNFGNGWYRCAFTFTALAASSSVYVQLATGDNTATSYTGDGVSGIFIWGAQLEAGAFATSYIPTVASQVTRTADQASIVAPMFAPWYNQTEGTFVASFDSYLVDLNTRNALSAYASGATSNNILLMNTQQRQFQINNAGNQADLDGGTPTSGTVTQVAGAYKVNDFALSLNGGAVVTDTSGTVPTVDRLNIGISSLSTTPINGHIRRITYYPVRLLDTQLQALTA